MVAIVLMGNNGEDNTDWLGDAAPPAVAREVAMDAKTSASAAMATATSSHLVRGERLPFDCSVMKVCSGSKEGLSLHQFYSMLRDRRRVRRDTRYQIARAGTLQTSIGWSKANGSQVALRLGETPVCRSRRRSRRNEGHEVLAVTGPSRGALSYALVVRDDGRCCGSWHRRRS
jgi:hypothetical protein